jgi:hypothetical protein
VAQAGGGVAAGRGEYRVNDLRGGP